MFIARKPPPFRWYLPVLNDGKHIMTNTSHAPNTCVLDFLHVRYMQQDSLYWLNVDKVTFMEHYVFKIVGVRVE